MSDLTKISLSLNQRLSLVAILVGTCFASATSAGTYTFTDVSQSFLMNNAYGGQQYGYRPTDEGTAASNNIVNINIPGDSYSNVQLIMGGYSTTSASTGNTLRFSSYPSRNADAVGYGGLSIGYDASGNTIELLNDSYCNLVLNGGDSFGGNAYNNTIVIDTTGTVDGSMYAAGRADPMRTESSSEGEVYGNHLIFRKANTETTNSVTHMGGFSDYAGDVYQNTVDVYSDTTPNARSVAFIGGYRIDSGADKVYTVHDNTVTLHEGSKVTEATGGYHYSYYTNDDRVINNVVNVYGEASTVYGGVKQVLVAPSAEGTIGEISGNVVEVFSSGKVTDTIVGGRAFLSNDGGTLSAVITNNKVILHGGADVSTASINVAGIEEYSNGGLPSLTSDDSESSSATSTATRTITGNTLVLDGWQGSVKSLGGFQQLEATITADIDPTSALITVTESLTLPETGLEAITLTVDDAAATKLTATPLTLFSTAEGATVSGTLLGESTVQTVYSSSGLLYADAVFDESGTLTLGEVKTTTQTHGYFEGVSAMLALTSQAASVTTGSDMRLELDRLDQNGGAAAVGSIQGMTYRWKTGSHIDVDGVNASVGVASKIALGSGNLTVGGFAELGYSDFDTYSDFKTSGDAQYAGLALLGIWTADCGFYAEGSVRAGYMDGDFTAENNNSKISQNGMYTGFHVGAGMKFPITDAISMDGFARYFYTHQSLDDFTVSGAQVAVESAESSRTQLGIRAVYDQSNWSGWASVAWEQEFEGEAEGRVSGVVVQNSPTLEGNTAVIEAGLRWSASETSPWSVNAQIGGHAGDRDGFFISLGGAYRF